MWKFVHQSAYLTELLARSQAHETGPASRQQGGAWCGDGGGSFMGKEMMPQERKQAGIRKPNQQRCYERWVWRKSTHPLCVPMSLFMHCLI